MGSLLEPLSMKTEFLVAVASTRRVFGTPGSANWSFLYGFFYKDKVSLSLHPKFMLRLVSAFHMNQSFQLPVFPKPHSSKAKGKLHTLHVYSALAFYINCIKLFKACSRLFVSYAERIQGQQYQFSVSHWLSNCIKHCFELCDSHSSENNGSFNQGLACLFSLSD